MKSLLKEIVELLVDTHSNLWYSPGTMAPLQEQQVKRKKLHIPLPEDLLGISKMFQVSGKQFFLVGGAVRDALMGKQPKDLDIATDALPDESIRILRQNPNFKIIEVGKSFGVVKVLTPEGNEYEVASFRKDLSGGRRPDAVEFVGIEQDVARRDLTMNALFYDVEKGEVVDFVGGMDDIEKGVVKTVGDAKERFDEDRLRILRAIRFAGRLGTKLDPSTAQAIHDNSSLAGVSGERIRDEFLKGIKSAKSVPYFLGLISEFGLWSQVFPGLSVRASQEAFKDTKNVPVLLAILLQDNAPEAVLKALNKAKYSADEVTQIHFLVSFNKLFSVDNAYKFKKLFNRSKLSKEDLSEFARLNGNPPERLVYTFNKYELSVTGEDLQARGLSGKELGAEMEHLEQIRFKELLS